MNATDNTTQATAHVETSSETPAGDGHEPRSFGGSMPLRRPVHDRMLGGVASGIADYRGVDETLVRIAILVAKFVRGAPRPATGWWPGYRPASPPASA